MKIQLLLAASVFAMPANAAVVTWNLWDWPAENNTNHAQVDAFASGGQQLTITAKLWTGTPPDQLTNVSQFNQTATVRKTDGTNATNGGLGVTGGGSTEQVDTNTVRRREAFLVQSSSILKLTSLKLNMIDANDTIQIYGVNDVTGGLVSLGFAGMIGGTGGSALVGATWNAGTGTLTFMPKLPAYKTLVFTTREGGEEVINNITGQGYRLAGISAAVPEPATWAMMLGGFGLLGATVRRSRRTTVVYS